MKPAISPCPWTCPSNPVHRAEGTPIPAPQSLAHTHSLASVLLITVLASHGTDGCEDLILSCHINCDGVCFSPDPPDLKHLTKGWDILSTCLLELMCLYFRVILFIFLKGTVLGRIPTPLRQIKAECSLFSLGQLVCLVWSCHFCVLVDWLICTWFVHIFVTMPKQFCRLVDNKRTVFGLFGLETWLR